MKQSTNIIIINNEKMLECPICGKYYKSLSMHIRAIHKMSIKDFKAKYPNMRMQLIPPKQKVICPYCNKIISGNSALALHINIKHGSKKYIEWKKNNNIGNCNHIIDKSKYPICSICGRVTQQICQHVRLTHNIKWDEYCKTYNYTGPKTYFSPDHHKNLSKNKLKYYQSPAGIIERKRLSKKFTGNNNPACDPEVRKKISDSAIKRLIQDDNHFARNSYGIRVKFEYDNILYSVRSFTEYTAIILLLNAGIKLKYEPHMQINYFNVKTNAYKSYLPDLLIENDIIELKAEIRNRQQIINEKYGAIAKTIKNTGKYDFKLYTLNEILDRYNVKYDRIFVYDYAKTALNDDKMSLCIRTYHKNSNILNKLYIDKNHRNVDYIELKPKGKQ